MIIDTTLSNIAARGSNELPQLDALPPLDESQRRLSAADGYGP